MRFEGLGLEQGVGTLQIPTSLLFPLVEETHGTMG